MFASTRTGLSGAWSTPEIIGTETSLLPSALAIAIPFPDSPELVWAILQFSGNFTALEVSRGINTFPPLSPSAFTGFVSKNRFLTQTDIINNLQWLPSPDPFVTSYNIYRNGTLIATIPSEEPNAYADHNRNKKVTYVYELTAVNAEGLQSSPVTLTLPQCR